MNTLNPCVEGPVFVMVNVVVPAFTDPVSGSKVRSCSYTATAVPFPDAGLAHDEELSVLTPESEATLWTAPDELEVAVLPAPLHATESVLAATARTKTSHLRERMPPVLTGSVILATDAAGRADVDVL